MQIWFLVRLVAGLVAWLAIAPAVAAAQPRSCTVAGQNLYVRDVLDEFYYWNPFLPDVDPVRYPSPEAYLEAVRYRPLDQTFSYLAPKAEIESLYSASQFVGFGFSSQASVSSEGPTLTVRVTQVFPASPAAEAGLARGDAVLSVGGRSVTEWYLAGLLDAAFGPPTAGYSTTIVVRRNDSVLPPKRLTKRVVTIPTVWPTRVVDVDGLKVGYLFFRNFVEPSVEALDAAFHELNAAGVRELVLDLRYNGGGLVSVAQHLSSLIGGARTRGQVLARYRHNERNAFRDRTLRFVETDEAMTLDRLFVITTRASASASELVINALRPYLPVVLVGNTTYGKPVGQYAIDVCDKTFFPVSFALVNANGQGDYFGGLPVTCAAVDELDRALGDPEEASLAEAVHVIRTGTCSTVPLAGSRVRRASVLAPAGDGLRQLVGAW